VDPARAEARPADPRHGPWRSRRSRRLEVGYGHGRSGGGYRSAALPVLFHWICGRCLEQRRSGARSRRGCPPVRRPSPCSPSVAGLELGSVRSSPIFVAALSPTSGSAVSPSAAPSLYCLSTASAATSLLASSGWDGAQARGPAAPSARPGASRPNGTPPDMASPQPNATIASSLTSPGAA
jgi:hypothetical protein